MAARRADVGRRTRRAFQLEIYLRALLVPRLAFARYLDMEPIGSVMLLEVPDVPVSGVSPLVPVPQDQCFFFVRPAGFMWGLVGFRT